MRIASFNLENFADNPKSPDVLAERIAVMRPQLERLRADVLCLQEVNGQKTSTQPRVLSALDKLLENTSYANFQRVSTLTVKGEPYEERNLVILSRLPIIEHKQIKHQFAEPPWYKKVTATPPEDTAKEVTWERPLLYAQLDLGGGRGLHVVNLHLKSRLPSNVDGQMLDQYTWKTASGWAEGYFISSMKRVGQALETRRFVDSIFDADEQALIVLCGDFNAAVGEVPLEAIRGAVENTNNPKLSNRVLVACEQTVPESSRFSLYHRGKGEMLDHVLASRGLLSSYRGTEVHNEMLHDESVGFATDKLYPESDHAPVVVEFALKDH
ncbi:MAG: endonuclease/exonuclease/phosphatase family protein [Methylococcaceae bacterium]|nr:endonuclease/exonuclease/phosphatase family protein [Methylococcaceae bacterium]MDP3902831.1 endonuclease/exonuclease/phosphatase family protein [Methylococcaceae bacterium]